MEQTRRDFLMASSAGLACTCAGLSGCAAVSGKSAMPAVAPEASRASDGKLVIDLARVPALGAVGGSAKAVAPGTDKKICIIHPTESHFEAFVNRCTHGGRELEYLHLEKRLRCVSFGHSQFDLEGRKLSGPAKGNLTRLPLSRTGDTLEISI